MSPGTYDVSASALRPLMKTFWSSQGWRSQPSWPSPEAFNRAVSAGLMFTEPLVMDHDECVMAAQDAANCLTTEEVSEAFIASLNCNRNDLRSALGSFAVALQLPEHEYSPIPHSTKCEICGEEDRSQEDLNKLNFERFKWGGMRRDSVPFIAFDLELFAHAPRESVDRKSLAIGHQLIAALRTAPPEATPNQVASRLKMIKGNQAEREVILDILGVCGVLRTSQHRGYAKEFVTAVERVLPSQRYVDRAYPVCWWRGRDGVNEDALREFLPQLAL